METRLRIDCKNQILQHCFSDSELIILLARIAFKDRVLLSDIRNVNCCLNTCIHLNKSTFAFPPVRENRIQLYKVFILTIEPQFLILMFTPC
jgi:hypothetical protein